MLKAPALLGTHRETNGAIMGPDADTRAMQEYLKLLRDSLGPGDKVMNLHVGSISSRVDLTNKAIGMARSILGNKVEGDIEVSQPHACFLLSTLLNFILILRSSSPSWHMLLLPHGVPHS